MDDWMEAFMKYNIGELKKLKNIPAIVQSTYKIESNQLDEIIEQIKATNIFLFFILIAITLLVFK